MTRKEARDTLMERQYSFEKVHAITQIATEDRYYEDKMVKITVTRTLDSDVFELEWKC